MQNVAADFASLPIKYKANDAPLEVLRIGKFSIIIFEVNFPLQILNKTTLNQNITITKYTNSVQILYRQFIPKQPNSFREK